jgi:hypothetical protein
LYQRLIWNLALQFKQNPDAWVTVGNILQEASYLQTKCVFELKIPPLVLIEGQSPADPDRHCASSP